MTESNEAQLLRVIELLNEDTRKLAADVSKLSASYEVLNNELESLLRIVRDGNGRESLISLVTRLDERVSQIVNQAPTVAKVQESPKEVQHKLTLQLAIIGGAVSILSTILPLVLSLVLSPDNTPLSTPQKSPSPQIQPFQSPKSKDQTSSES